MTRRLSDPAGESGRSAGNESERTWLPLAADERVRWRGGPRPQTVYPWLALTVLGALTVLVAVAIDVLSPLGLVWAALFAAPTAWQYARISRTAYVITTRRVAIKRGVLGRSVRTVSLEHVQNTTVTQNLTGRLVGYGTVAIDTAGGAALEFRRVDDPSAARTELDRQRKRRRRPRSTSAGEAPANRVPGTLDRWRDVRTEVRRLRRSLENAR